LLETIINFSINALLRVRPVDFYPADYVDYFTWVYFITLFCFGVLYLITTLMHFMSFRISAAKAEKMNIFLRRFIPFTGITGIVMFLIGALYTVNYINYKAPIPYAAWREIVPSDFRGLKRPDIQVDNKYEYANIKSKFDIKKDKDKITVTTYFFPSRSYVFNSRKMHPDMYSTSCIICTLPKLVQGF
jgi:hypothetical protein